MIEFAIFLVKLIMVLFLIDCVLFILKDFFPSCKTVFGIVAIIAGLFGLNKLRKHFKEKDEKEKEQIKEGETIQSL